MNHRSSKQFGLFTRALVIALPLFLAACSSPEQRAQAHYESGNELLSKEEFVRAGLEFRNAIKYNDKLSEAWYGLALVEEKAGNIRAVLNNLNRVVELDPKNVKAEQKLATYFLAVQDIDNALIHANAANELKPNDSAILALRAAVLFRLNDLEGSKAEAEKALAFNPDNPDAHGILAAGEIAKENPSGAMLFVDRGLKTDPKNLGLLLLKSRIYEISKDDVNLEANLRRTIEAQPQLFDLRRPLLAFLVSRKRMDDAESEMRKFAAAKPDDHELALGLVSFVNQVRGQEAGRIELDRLQSERPDVAAFKLAGVRMDFAAGKFDAAKAVLDQIIAKGEPQDDVKKARILLASMYVDKKDFAKAGEIIDAVLAADAKDADALTLKASIKFDTGDYDGAIQGARDALNQAAQSVALHLILGRAHERQGAVELAAERYAEATKLSNFNPGVALEYANFLMTRGKSAQAESVVSDALAVHANNVQLLSAMARLKLGKAEYDEAQKIAEQIKQLGGANDTAEQIMTTSLMGQKKYDEVIASVESGATAAPQAAKPLANVVQAYVQAGKTGEAEKVLRAVIEANAKNAEAFALLGTVKNIQNKPDEAEADFRKAIEVQPDNPVGYRALAIHQFSRGNREAGEATLRDGRKHSPRDPSLALALAGLLEQDQRIDEAIAVYEEQIAATPNALIIINNLASLLADHRSDQASLDRADQIAQRLRGVTIPHFKDTLGWIAYRRGEYQEALSQLKDAVAQLPNQPLIKYHLAMTYVALKQSDNALEQFNAAKALIKQGDPLIAQIDAGLEKANAKK